MNYIIRALMIVALLPGMVFSAVPGQVNFQGVLLDNAGQTVTGSVNFDFSMFDAATGGTLLWSESQAGVTVTAGMYSVALGSMTPLTTGVLDGGAVYLEVTVGGEILTPRQRLLAVPYALKAEEAANVSGVSGTFIQQIYQHVSYDGNNIANDDPREGFVDVDGDGLANFIDPDNDNDGASDATEDSNGTDINLVTPVITSIGGPWESAPPNLPIAGQPNPVTITGSGFLPGISVQVGPENPVPQNVTSTSLDITVGSGQPGGPVTVTLDNLNTQVANDSLTFLANDRWAFISNFLHPDAGNQTAAAADAFCTQQANNAGLTGSYVAWYSTASSNAKDRLTSVNEPWARTDYEVVATDLVDLTDGSIAIALNKDENGVTRNDFPTTNTLVDGTYAGACIMGRSVSKSNDWTNWSSTDCTIGRRYYCFSQ